MKFVCILTANVTEKMSDEMSEFNRHMMLDFSSRSLCEGLFVNLVSCESDWFGNGMSENWMRRTQPRSLHTSFRLMTRRGTRARLFRQVRVGEWWSDIKQRH